MGFTSPVPRGVSARHGCRSPMRQAGYRAAASAPGRGWEAEGLRRWPGVLESQGRKAEGGERVRAGPAGTAVCRLRPRLRPRGGERGPLQPSAERQLSGLRPAGGIPLARRGRLRPLASPWASVRDLWGGGTRTAPEGRSRLVAGHGRASWGFFLSPRWSRARTPKVWSALSSLLPGHTAKGASLVSPIAAEGPGAVLRGSPPEVEMATCFCRRSSSTDMEGRREGLSAVLESSRECLTEAPGEPWLRK